MKKIIFTTLIFCLAFVSAPAMAATVTDDYISDPGQSYLVIDGVYVHDSSQTGTWLDFDPNQPAVHVTEPKPYPTGYPADDDTTLSHWEQDFPLGTSNWFGINAPAGTDWIWDSELANNGETNGSSTDPARWGHAVLFRVDFPIPATAINLNATIHITADNCYACWLEGGTRVDSATAWGTAGWETSDMLQAQVKTDGWETVGHHSLDGLAPGSNTLWVLAGNENYNYPDNPVPPTTYWQYNAGGAIFWLEVTYEEEEEETGDEGCTPGFWKNNGDKKGASAWYCYVPSDDFSYVFGIPEQILRDKGKKVFTNPTLLQALGANGSGVNLMARSAVAALLNACNPDVLYPLTETEIKTAVQDAVDAGLEQELGEYLDDLNNLGCPINQKGQRLFPLPE